MHFPPFLVALFIAATLAQHDAASPFPYSDPDVDPFRRNLELNIPEHDELLQKNLRFDIRSAEPDIARPVNKVITYSLRRKLPKRASAPYGPLFQFQCLFCEGQRPDIPVELSQLTKHHMLEKMLWNARVGHCLFYGQRKKGSIPPRLSEVATEYSCANPGFFRTIWQLWPSESEIIDGRNVANCFFEQNYYCLDYATPKCCWLNGILGPVDLHWQDNGMAYFRAMSRAMAMSCRGTIYILTDNPYEVMKPLPEYATTPSIWIYDEVDEMRALYAQGSITDVKAIIYTPFMINPSVMDVTALVFGNGRKVKRSVDDDLKMKIALSTQKKFAAQTAEMIMSGEIEMPTLDGIQKRTPWCTDSYLQENPYLDYFG